MTRRVVDLDYAPPEVDLDAIDALSDALTSPVEPEESMANGYKAIAALERALMPAEIPPIPPAFCANCLSVPVVVVAARRSIHVACQCGKRGRICATVDGAKHAWGRAQWNLYTTDKDDQYDSNDDTAAGLRATRRASVARAYAAYRQRNPLTIAARSWATHRVSSCCGAAYAIKRHHKQDDPVAICRKCGQSFHLAVILKAKQEHANGR